MNPSTSPLGTPRPSRAPLIAGVTLLLGAGIMALGFGGSQSSPSPASPAGPGKPPSAPAPVTTATAFVGTLENEVRVPGELVPTARATLRARVFGQVLRRNVELGELVDQGALLYALDPGTLAAELARANAVVEAARTRHAQARLLLEQAERDGARKAALQAEGALSAAELDQASTSAATAKLEVELAAAERARAEAEAQVLRVRLSDTEVRAPFRGRVAALHGELGSMVTAGEVLVDLVADGPLTVRFSVPEGDASRLALGQPLGVSALGVRYEASVTRIGAALEPVARSLPVEAALLPRQTGADPPGSKEASSALSDRAPDVDAAGEPRLLPGMFVEVLWRAQTPPQTVLVPLAALTGNGPVRTLFTTDDDRKVQERTVRVLLADGEHAAVAGLEPGTEVVTAGAEALSAGQRVEVVR